MNKEINKGKTEEKVDVSDVNSRKALLVIGKSKACYMCLVANGTVLLTRHICRDLNVNKYLYKVELYDTNCVDTAKIPNLKIGSLVFCEKSKLTNIIIRDELYFIGKLSDIDLVIDKDTYNQE